MQKVLPAVGVLTGDSSAYVAVNSAVLGAQTDLQFAQGLGNAAMATFATPSQPGVLNVAPGNPDAGIAAVTSAVNGSSLVAGASQALGYVNRMAANLAYASS